METSAAQSYEYGKHDKSARQHSLSINQWCSVQPANHDECCSSSIVFQTVGPKTTKERQNPNTLPHWLNPHGLMFRPYQLSPQIFLSYYHNCYTNKKWLLYGAPPCLLGYVNSLNVNGLEYLPIYVLMAGISKTSSGNACLRFDEFTETSNIWHAIQILDVCGNWSSRPFSIWRTRALRYCSRSCSASDSSSKNSGSHLWIKRGSSA